ncbi:MAG: DUF5661 family protein [Chloroflexota bacterium]
MVDADAAYHALGQPEIPQSYNEEFVRLLAQSMSHELEHCDLTHGDPIMTARIALAHLREDPDYYKKLKAAGL